MKEKEIKNLKKKNLTSNFQHLTTSKGITLIALVITIIVMLILVAVTISMAINGGLFNYGGRAVGETQNAINKEQDLGNGRIKVGYTWYDSIDAYLNNIPSDVQDKGELPEGIKVGDYVNYEPTPSESGYDVTTAMSGFSPQHFTTQTGEQALKWRVWSIDKENETVELVAATQISRDLYLGKTEGYNHGVDILNDMCKALYSNGKAIARSINVEDINSKTTYDITSYPGYGKQSYIYDEDDIYPSIYDAELTGLSGSKGVRQENGEADYTTYTGKKKKKGLKPTFTYYSYYPEDYLRTDLEENNAVTGLINTGTQYWLASRCVQAYSSNWALFEIRVMRSSGELDSVMLDRSGDQPAAGQCHVRPIVSLPDSTIWAPAEEQINDTQTWDITF